MTWTCCGTARCRRCSAGSGRRPRWARSCAPSPGGMSARLEKVQPAVPGGPGPPAPRCCPARTCWRSWTSTRCKNGSTGIRSRAPAFGHTKIQGKSLLVRGLNALAAAISTPLAAPVIAATRLRGGNANSARGAASLAAEAVSAARAAGCTGKLVVRIDSAYYSARDRRDPPRRGVLLGHRPDGPARSAPRSPPSRETAWTAIKYPQAIWDEEQHRWISDAEVAEVPYTAFASKKGQAITARLIVRRVRDLNRKAAAGPGRAVCRLALPRRVHRLPVRAPPGRRPAPRPRHRRAGLRGPDRRAARAPAIGLVSRQRGLARPAPPSPIT